MINHDIKFELQKRIWSDTANVEWQSTLKQFMRGGEESVVLEGMQAFIERRRRWLDELRATGLPQLQGDKYRFARNCRPPMTAVLPKGIRACNLSFCPFCHARKAAAVHKQLQDRYDAGAKTMLPPKVVVYSRIVDHGSDNPCNQIRINEATGQLVHAYFEDNVWNYARGMRKTVREMYFPKVIDGYSWHAFIPKLATTPAAGILGHWTVFRSAVVVVPNAWDYAPSEYLTISDEPTRKDMVTLVSKALQYPKAWMTNDPKFMAEQFDITSGTRCLSRYGSRDL